MTNEKLPADKLTKGMQLWHNGGWCKVKLVEAVDTGSLYTVRIHWYTNKESKPGVKSVDSLPNGLWEKKKS